MSASHRRLTTLCAIAAAATLIVPAAASAAGTVHLSADRYDVSEGAGNAVITVTRTEAARGGEVRYAVYHKTAQQFQDYQPVRGRIDFAPGQTTATFEVPIVDDPLVEPDETATVGIYGAYPERVGKPDRALLTIEDNDAISTDPRDTVNPLGLNPAPTGDNPLEGARFYSNPSQTIAGTYARQIRGKNPTAAKALQVIADQPEAKRFGSFNAQPGYVVSKYLAEAFHSNPGEVPLLGTYRFHHHTCGGYSDSPAEAAAYKKWYRKFAQGIGNNRVVVFYEIDALITAKCLSGQGLKTRIDEMRSAIDTLSRVPHAVVYVDAGASDARPPQNMAKLLRAVGVDKIQGFFTNATHQNKTIREIKYANKISAGIGGKHYVINTATNGKGALRPRSRVKFGNSIRCNAPDRGLGPKPTSDVPARFAKLDGVFWIGNPGRSAGGCGKTDAATGTFVLDYALDLIKNANFRLPR
ncbi:glycoside hydrolase family 6 protein [Conexibacter sp. CPCC 206217]|uniref:glycoside hydrolase family 6 protein n=1 Tax=Conexibacter sp. CPCC 206217 TaxID=3064574 RepID=UPI00271659CE|nr:glycoside hydrolase family 6 protein [Conexibacter sp. CPCC 206217]MDO8213188.1 glycoside hydrolase family 6 protein [Conexibacter sp. CPCC 206217]